MSVAARRPTQPTRSEVLTGLFLGETFVGGQRHFIVAYSTTKTGQGKEASNAAVARYSAILRQQVRAPTA